MAVSFKSLQDTTQSSGFCQSCKQQILEPIYMMQMLAQDMSLMHLDRSRLPAGARLGNQQKNQKVTEEFVRVLLYTNGGLCNKFFNSIPPTNLYRENTTRMMI